MAQHKWHKEIKAWADGAEIEYYAYEVWTDWHPEIGWFEDYEYRIKPQPKEPQYLYVYKKVNKHGDHIGGYAFSMNFLDLSNYAGKIKLEVDDE